MPAQRRCEAPTVTRCSRLSASSCRGRTGIDPSHALLPTWRQPSARVAVVLWARRETPMDIASAEKKLRQAEFFLSYLEHASKEIAAQYARASRQLNQEPLEYYFSACLSAAQSVFYILAKTGGPKFKAMAHEWRANLTNDSARARFNRMVGIRDGDVHFGKTGATPLPKYIEEDRHGAYIHHWQFYNAALFRARAGRGGDEPRRDHGTRAHVARHDRPLHRPSWPAHRGHHGLPGIHRTASLIAERDKGLILSSWASLACSPRCAIGAPLPCRDRRRLSKRNRNAVKSLVAQHGVMAFHLRYRHRCFYVQ